MNLAGELAQKVLLTHAVLKGLVPIDEDDGNFVVVLPAKLVVAVDVYFAPSEAAAARQFRQAFFDDFTEMTSFARVNYYVAWLHGWRNLSALVCNFPAINALLSTINGTVVGPLSIRLSGPFVQYR